MKRKIEKYMAKKQGCEVTNIQLTDDGRFDFGRDLDGVLGVVRGKEGTVRSGKKSDKKQPKKPSKKKRDMPPNHMSHHMNHPHAGMHHPPHPMYMHPHHPAYMHGMHGPHPPPPPHMQQHPSMSMRPSSKQSSSKDNHRKPSGRSSNAALYPKSAPSMDNTTHNNKENRQPMHQHHNKSSRSKDNIFTAYSPRKSNNPGSPIFAMTPGSTMKTPSSFAMNTGDFPSRYFDECTPSKDGGNSLEGLEVTSLQGMTPLSNLRETFSSTPFNGDDLFSPSGDLNKTLFGDADPASLEAILKTPKPKSVVECMRIRIGSHEKKTKEVVQQFQHVSISPIVEGVTRSKRFTPRSTTPYAETPTLDHPLSVSFADHDSTTKRRRITMDGGDKHNLFLEPPASTTKSISAAQTPNNITMDTTADDSSSFHDITAPSPFDPSAILQTPGTVDSRGSFWGMGFSPAEPDFTPFQSPKRRRDDDDNFVSAMMLKSASKSNAEAVESPKRRKLEPGE
jgi:hypothetical protein